MSHPEPHSSPDIAVSGEHAMDLPKRARAGKRACAAVIAVAVVLGVGATRTVVSNVVKARHPVDLTKQQRLASEREEVQIHGQRPAIARRGG